MISLNLFSIKLSNLGFEHSFKKTLKILEVLFLPGFLYFIRSYSYIFNDFFKFFYSFKADVEEFLTCNFFFFGNI